MINLNKKKMAYSFLNVGKTNNSNNERKLYIGLASSHVLDVNPSKQELEGYLGHELANEPEYVGEKDGTPFVRIDFIVRTDPQCNNDIEITERASIYLRNAIAYNKDGSKVQVIDKYGNHTWVSVETAKANKPIMQVRKSTGETIHAKIDDTYRMARMGEADLVDFLKAYLNVQDVFRYDNGTWVMRDNPLDYEFNLEHVDDYFKGDVTEIKEAIQLQPNNKVNLLYGVRTTEKGQFQDVCMRGDMVSRNRISSKGMERLAISIQNMGIQNTEYKVAALQEYKPTITSFTQPHTFESSSNIGQDDSLTPGAFPDSLDDDPFKSPWD